MEDTLTAVPTNPTHERPDWSHLFEEICCPLCEYNLRGLSEPQCPECGYRFQWPDVLDPTRRSHPYLFEFHPKKNFTSFWKTAFHGLRPLEFWNTLRAGQRCVKGRLALYCMVVTLAVLFAFAGQVALLILRYNLNIRWWAGNGGYALPAPYSIQLPSWIWGEWGPLAVIVLAWPWLTYLCLSIFQASMRRAKVKQVHVLRCVVYSSDVFFWVALIAFIYSACQAVGTAFEPSGYGRMAFYASPTVSTLPHWAWTIAGLIFVYRLIIAYWRYLRFRHAIATVFTTQIIVFLTVLVIAWVVVRASGLVR